MSDPANPDLNSGPMTQMPEPPVKPENPLAGYFRTPALWLALPSRGEWWKPGAVELNEQGEVAVYPMTAKDEISLNTPDSLYSGQSTLDVIHSCVPAIKDANEVPSIDLDAILVAIRIASQGKDMDMTVACPSCEHTNDFTVDLTNVLESFQYIDFSQGHEIAGLTFYLQPQPFRNINQVGIKTFAQQREVAAIQASSLSDEEKVRRIQDHVQKVSMYAVDIIASFVRMIVMPDGTEVTNRDQIDGMFTDIPSGVYKQIKEVVESYKDQTSPKKLSATCAGCGHSWEAPIEFESSNFFG